MSGRARSWASWIAFGVGTLACLGVAYAAYVLAAYSWAQVVEYRRPFSLAGFLSLRSKNILNFDRAMLYELSTPQLLYLWTGY